MNVKLTEDYLTENVHTRHLRIWKEFVEGNIKTGGNPRSDDGCNYLLTKLEGTKRHKDVYILDTFGQSDDQFIRFLEGYVNTILADDSLITQFHVEHYRRSIYNVYVVTYIFALDLV